jgi:lipopolysaccharide transport system ATP-binding protein
MNVVKLENISKSYHIYAKPSDRLKQFLFGGDSTKFYKDFWALKNISFEIKKGEAVGIIGENGAGKSTLLEIIAGTLTPTEGICNVNGRISALLELGSGFNPEFTGKENIYMGSAILGLKKKEIENKYHEIVKFADIDEDFLDRPVKTYSSGMMMRLAFAVSTCTEPDILIVDEALSVGDAIFQSKCYSRILKMIENGTSLLFVSHSIDTVKNLCSKAIWINHGKSEIWGNAQEVCKEYEKFCWKKQGIELDKSTFEKEKNRVSAISRPTTDAQEKHSIPEVLFQYNPLLEKMANEFGRYGTGEVKIKNFILTDKSGNTKDVFDYNEELTAYLLLTAYKNIDSDFILGFRISDIKGHSVLEVIETHRINKLILKENSSVVLKFNFKLLLSHSLTYSIKTAILIFKDGTATSMGKYDFNKALITDSFESITVFKVRENHPIPFGGPVCYPVDITQISL